MPLLNKPKIVKVPLTAKEKNIDHPKAFPKFRTLYLELLENKNKIKQDLINKEHIYNNNLVVKTVVPIPSIINTLPVIDEDEENIPDLKNTATKVQDTPVKAVSTATKVQATEVKKKKDKSHSENDSDSENDSHSESDSNSSSCSDDKSSDSEDEPKKKRLLPDKKKYGENIEIKEQRSGDKSDSLVQHLENVEDDEKSEDDIDDRLKKLLEESSDDEKKSKTKYNKVPKKSVYKSSSNKFTPYDKFKNNFPPTLSELQAKGEFVQKKELRDINNIGKEEYNNEDKKREIMFKFELLKKSYPLAAATIPVFTIHSDLSEMEKTYDLTVKRLSLDSSVESYKSYLLGGFMLVEFILGSVLKFDMQGFTQQQIININTYERLLIEIGEKSYVPSGSKWPVEIRLLFIIIMNAGIFIIGKVIMKKTGSNIMNMMNNMTNPQSSVHSKTKRKMKGPSIDLEDIPDVV